MTVMESILTFVKNKDNILDFRNATLFVVAVPCLASYAYYQYSLWIDGPNQWGRIPFDTLYPYVGIYAAIDLCTCSTLEIGVHHLFIFAIIIYGKDVSLDHRFLLTYPLLKTEISSIFLVLKYWIPETSRAYPINLAIFYATFLKFRVYDYYFELLQNNTVFDLLETTYPDYSFMPVCVSVYGLFYLNLYWSFVITKIVYKNLVKGTSDRLCHFLCGYIYLVNIPVALTVYAYKPTTEYLYDITGIGVLSLFTYRYHHDIYHRMCLHQLDEYDTPSRENAVKFVMYVLSIQLRSFLAVVTNQSSPYSILTSGVIHLFFIVQTAMLHIIETLMDHSNHKHQFLKNHRTILSIPLMYDGWLIGSSSSNDIRIPLILIQVSLFLQCMVKPFYKYTDVSYALEMIVSTYVTSKANLALH